MPTYKLMYWNSRGRAETSRMLFALAGVEFEDYRFKDGEWPGDLKGNADLFPLGQAPSLLIDGKAMPQSKAIHRHLAREFGLYGANNEEARLIDVVSETVEDILAKMIPMFYEKDEAKKKELLEAFKISTKPFLDYLNKMVEKPGTRFFVGNSETLADVYVFWTVDYMFELVPSTYTAHPALVRFHKGIKENSKLTEYVKNRPEIPT